VVAAQLEILMLLEVLLQIQYLIPLDQKTLQKLPLLLAELVLVLEMVLMEDLVVVPVEAQDHHKLVVLEILHQFHHLKEMLVVPLQALVVPLEICPLVAVELVQ